MRIAPAAGVPEQEKAAVAGLDWRESASPDGVGPGKAGPNQTSHGVNAKAARSGDENHICRRRQMHAAWRERSEGNGPWVGAF